MAEATTRESILAKLRDFKERHGEEFGLRSIGIFGSFARDDAREDSDIDVVFDTSMPNLLRTSRMRLDLEDLFGRHVDVVRFREDMNPRLRERIRREAHYV